MSQLAQVAPYVRSVPATPSRIRSWHVLAIVLPIIWLYFPVLLLLVKEWWKDPNFSHAFAVPLFSLHLLIGRRQHLQLIVRKPSWWGLLIVAFSMAMLILGELGAEIFSSRISVLFLIFGLTVLFAGWSYMRALLFPWAFLFFMIPIPAIVINQVTIPLQILSSKLAAGALPLFGVPVLREGNVINLPAMPLEVAEACSGIRSLIALTALAVMYGQVTERSHSIRLMLAVAAIPIAICANSLRIIGTGLLVQYWTPEAAKGFFHSFSGWLIFLVSLGMLFGLHRVLVRAKTRAQHGT